LTGLTREIVGTGTESGITYVDIRLSGTPSAAGSYQIFTDAGNNPGAAALNGQTWNASFYTKIAAGTTAGISNFNLNIAENNAAGAFIANSNSSFTPTTSALATQRPTHTRALNQATTAFTQQYIAINLTGAAIDITLRIGLPQLEQGAFATSVIPTVNAFALGVTREKDVASVNTLSPWYNATAGTLYAEWVARLGVDQQAFGLVNVGDGVRVRKRSTDQYGLVVRDPTNRDLALNASPAITEGQIIKVAGAYAINDLALSGGGQSPATGSTYSVVTATSAFIGGNVSAGATYVNGHIRRITYYPRRLSNADLQTITT
jgi:hypothetical protein